MTISLREISTRLQLRDAVHHAHAHAEQSAERIGIFDSAANYHRWLAAMHATHAHFATPVDLVADRFGLPRQSQALLEALARDMAAVTPDPMIPATDPCPHQNISAHIGINYVLEGSGMGARVLERRVQDAGLVHHNYISQLSTTSRHRWPAFKAALELASLDMDHAVPAAQSVFAYLSAALEAGNAHA